MHAEFLSTKHGVINAIGELVPNQPKIVGIREILLFQRMHKRKLGSANFPDHVQLTIVVDDHEEVKK